jgi:hypothetical protein
MQTIVSLLEVWEQDALNHYANSQGRSLADLFATLCALEFIHQAFALRCAKDTSPQVYSKERCSYDSQMERRIFTLFAD